MTWCQHVPQTYDCCGTPQADIVHPKVGWRMHEGPERRGVGARGAGRRARRAREVTHPHQKEQLSSNPLHTRHVMLAPVNNTGRISRQSRPAYAPPHARRGRGREGRAHGSSEGQDEHSL